MAETGKKHLAMNRGERWNSSTQSRDRSFRLGRLTVVLPTNFFPISQNRTRTGGQSLAGKYLATKFVQAGS
jgi:hypothetical protein